MTINLPPELLSLNSFSEEEVYRGSLPYAIAVNDKPAGLFVPLSQMELSGISIPDSTGIATLDMLETDSKGIFLTSFKISILAKSPAYLRYKSNSDDVEMSKRGTVFGKYSYDTHQENRSTVDACNDIAFILYDEDISPRNAVPLRVRLKNNSRWKSMAAIDSYYNKVDLAFAALLASQGIEVPQKQHDQCWRSNILLDVNIETVLHGATKQESSPVGEWKILNLPPTKENVAEALGVICNNPSLFQFQQEQLKLMNQFQSLDNVVEKAQQQRYNSFSPVEPSELPKVFDITPTPF